MNRSLMVTERRITNPCRKRTSLCSRMRSRKGMELVQVGILIAIAVGIGIIFKDNITDFVSDTFSTLLGTSFN